jgi:phage replication-related protein YjqB (UPF0714/DUF867 family)
MARMPHPARYQCFNDLAAKEANHYQVVYEERPSALLIFTPHGGGIEPGTSEIVRAMAGNDFSWYCFEGVSQDGNERLHITSTHFDEPILVQMLAKARRVIAIHGCGDNHRKILFTGGLHTGLAAHFVTVFQQAGFAAERGTGHISGTSTRNVCNRGLTRMGVQIEVSEALRRDLFMGLDRTGRQHPNAIFQRLVAAARGLMLEIDTPAGQQN